MSEPEGLGAGGAALWAQCVAAKPSMNPGELAVLVEACRIKDRLDRLHGLLIGDVAEWARVRDFDGDRESAVMVDKVLTEARLHAGELRQLVDKLRLDANVKKEADDGDVDQLAQLRANRASRQAGAAAT